MAHGGRAQESAYLWRMDLSVGTSAAWRFLQCWLQKWPMSSIVLNPVGSDGLTHHSSNGLEETEDDTPLFAPSRTYKTYSLKVLKS